MGVASTCYYLLVYSNSIIVAFVTNVYSFSMNNGVSLKKREFSQI